MCDIEFVESKRGAPIMLYKGYKLNKDRQNKDLTTRWRCSSRKCSGSATTNKEMNVVSERDHTCVVDCARNEVEKVLFDCKKRVREEMKPIPTTFERSILKIKDAGLDFVTELPTFSSKKSSLYRMRQKSLGVTKFLSRSELVLPEILIKDFLLIDDGSDDRILVFASTQLTHLLQDCDEFFADGTFKSCSKQFTQLYSIHADIGSNLTTTSIVPVVYALLPDKSANTYKRLFSLIKSHFPNWTPKYFKTDFEIAAIEAITNIFPSTIISGCNFHFNQCIWRKVQEYGLIKEYKEKEEVRTHIRLCASLAHIPIYALEDGWLFIMENSPFCEKITKFNDYFVTQWMDNDNIGKIWNCFGLRHRTTNALEGWHNRLNRYIGKSHPNVCELVQFLKEDAQHCQIIIRQTELYMTPKKRCTKYIKLDERIRKIQESYLNNEITVGRCLEKIAYTVKLKTD